MTEDVRYVEVRGGNSMNGKQFFFWIVLFAVVQIALAVLLPSLRPQHYEYRTVYLSPEKNGLFYGSALNEYGEEGWNVIQIVPASHKLHICYLRRPVLSDAESEGEERASRKKKRNTDTDESAYDDD